MAANLPEVSRPVLRATRKRMGVRSNIRATRQFSARQCVHTSCRPARPDRFFRKNGCASSAPPQEKAVAVDLGPAQEHAATFHRPGGQFLRQSFARIPCFWARAPHLRRAALSHSEVLGSLPQLLSGQQHGPAVEKRRSQRHRPIAELSAPDGRAGLPPSRNREPGPGTTAPHTDAAGRQWAKTGTQHMGRRREGGWNY